MSNPFERLRNKIESISIEFDVSSYTKPAERDVCCDDCAPVPSPKTFFTEAEMKKMISMYEEEKCKNLHTVDKLNKQISDLIAQLSTYKRQLQKATTQNLQLTNRIAEGARQPEKKQPNIAIQREKFQRQETERNNKLLQELNKEINEERARSRLKDQKISQLQLECAKLSEILKRNDEQLKEQLNQSKGMNEELKKLLQFQMISRNREFGQLSQDFDRRLKQKDLHYQQLEKYAAGLQANLNNQKEISYKLGQAIKNYEITMLNIQKDEQRKDRQWQEMKEHLTRKINQLVREVEQFSGIEKENSRLKQQLEMEKMNEKYHIVEVKDQTKEIELEVTKRQLMEMVKEKALFQEKMKRICKCKVLHERDYRQTMVEYDNKPKIEQYLKTHEVILRNQK